MATAPVEEPTNEPVPETEDWFASMDDDTQKDWANVLLWGKEGSYKTTAVARLANLPGPGKALVINAEGGLKKLALQRQGVDTSKLVFWPDPRKKEVLSRASLDKVFRRVKADLMRDPDSWKGIAWDSVTEIYQTVLNHATDARQLRLQNQGKDFDPDFVDRADYGTMSKMVRDLLRKFRDLPCHFFVTALERRDIDPDTNKPVYGPAISPALGTDLLGYVDVTIYMKSADEDGPGRGLTKDSVRFRVKDRFGVLPRVVANATADRIVGYITGDITEDEDPFQDDLPNKAKTAQDRPDVPLKTVDDEAGENDGTADSSDD